MIKHLFLDMDGTLLNSEGIISNSTVKLLKKCKYHLR
nr:HAD hydrolase family protein [Gemella sp. ND 6198]